MTSGSMTKAELVEEVSRVSDLTKKHSEVIVDTVFKSIIDALHRGEKIELRGFGSFRLRKREPRKGRNPEDGRQGGRAAEEGAVLQARQRAEGTDQQGARPGSAQTIGASRRVRGVVERLWSPWRLAYVTRAGGTATEDGGCVFCELKGRNEDLVLHRGRLAFVILNLYPYNNGHLMVVPNRHIADLAGPRRRRSAPS